DRRQATGDSGAPVLRQTTGSWSPPAVPLLATAACGLPVACGLSSVTRPLLPDACRLSPVARRLVHFGLLPESIELGDAHRREVKVACLSVRLDAAKARGELAGRRAQGILGVDTQVAADGGEGVQQIAHLITSLGIRGGGAQLVHLLAYLGQGAPHVRPVEAQLRRLAPDRLGQRERRQRRRDTVERRRGGAHLGRSLLRALDA